MDKLIFVSALLASTAFAYASDVTLMSANLPHTRGQMMVDTKFHIDTEMREGYAKVYVDERVTVYVQDCGYYGGGYNPRYPQPYPGPYCRTIPQTQYRTVMTDKVKIEGMTMVGDDVIYHGENGDVNCGKMGRSRVFRVPTFYLSGKCELDGRIVNENGVNKLTVSFKTK